MCTTDKRFSNGMDDEIRVKATVQAPHEQHLRHSQRDGDLALRLVWRARVQTTRKRPSDVEVVMRSLLPVRGTLASHSTPDA